MSTSKIKNIIIIVLVLLDVILLGIFVFDRAESKRATEAEITALANVLKERNITLGKDIAFDVYAPAPATVMRNEANDEELMDSLIDYSYIEDLGGNVIFYSSEIGEAMLRGTGEIDLVFNEELPNISSDYESSLMRYMRKRGIELYEGASEITHSGSGTTVLIPCMYNERCVYNAKLTFMLSGENLMMISGTRVFDGEIREQEDEVIDGITAVMYFVELINEKGYLCREISGLEAGYFMNVAVSGECALKPVWKISTDIGDFYINAVNGKAESLPA